MRWMVNMYRARLLGSLRHMASWLFLLAAVLLALVPMAQDSAPGAKGIPVAVVNQDAGVLSGELLGLLRQNSSLSVMETDLDTALRLLRLDRLEAVYLLNPDFTRRVEAGDYSGTVALYASPSSLASATLSEPVINDVLMLWIEETVVGRTRQFVEAQGHAYAPADERRQRARIAQVWEAGAPVVIREELQGQEALPEAGALAPALRSVLWFGAFAAFYFIVSAGWVLDIDKAGIARRLKQAGAQSWHIMAGAGLAQLTLCLGAWLLLLGIIASPLRAAGYGLLSVSLAMALYLTALLGATVAVASLVRHSMALLLLAPLLTFVNGVLGGLFVPLPDWASFLRTVSLFLPGRWLTMMGEGLSAGEGLTAAGPVFSALWAAIGILVSTLGAKEDTTAV